MDAILAAASDVFARKGFAGASVRDIARQANVGLSGLYYYFASKNDVLFEIQRNTFTTLINSLRERLETADTPESRLRAVVTNHFEFFASHMNDHKVCVHEMNALDGELSEKALTLRRQYFDLVRGVLTDAGGVSGRRTNLAALFLFGSMNWCYTWYDSAKHKDITELGATLAEIFLHGVYLLEDKGIQHDDTRSLPGMARCESR
ncbi:MAG TPA: TetR/AcrR family transcriptional regulator [candidate division Zixibacteria bacterium]|nr:TetR/AcrR family transcriptional regulator [candidate division Zixibacteria bacterium]